MHALSVPKLTISDRTERSNACRRNQVKIWVPNSELHGLGRINYYLSREEHHHGVKVQIIWCFLLG